MASAPGMYWRAYRLHSRKCRAARARPIMETPSVMRPSIAICRLHSAAGGARPELRRRPARPRPPSTPAPERSARLHSSPNWTGETGPSRSRPSAVSPTSSASSRCRAFQQRNGQRPAAFGNLPGIQFQRVAPLADQKRVAVVRHRDNAQRVVLELHHAINAVPAIGPDDMVFAHPNPGIDINFAAAARPPGVQLLFLSTIVAMVKQKGV